MKKLAISIFTYNRHIYVKQHIERIYEYAHQNGIDIYVFDGSSNDKTKMVIDRFNKDGEKIHYHQYDENAMNLRHRESLLLPNAEYIWITSDKLIWNPIIYKDIFDAINEDVDAIVLDCNNAENNRKSLYVNPAELFKDQYFTMALMGATIIKKSVVKKFIENRGDEKEFSFWFVTTYFNSLANKSIQVETLHYNPTRAWITVNKECSCSWTDRIFRVWSYEWTKNIEGLPYVYDKYKKNVMLDVGEKSEMFTFYGLCYLRSEKEYSVDVLKRYGKYIKKIVRMPRLLLIIVALIPESIAAFIWNLSGKDYAVRIKG